MFNEATQNNYKISFDERYTERPVKSDKIVQHDIGSAQHINSPKYLVFAQETKGRTNAPNKKITLLFLTISIFKNIMPKSIQYNILEIVYL